jgi:hypothetical protein
MKDSENFGFFGRQKEDKSRRALAVFREKLQLETQQTRDSVYTLSSYSTKQSGVLAIQVDADAEK